jgi:signal transduction histidine kinase
MKLITKYNRVNTIATISVLLLSAVCYYFFIRSVLVHQLDKNIKVEESEITDFVKENNQLPEPTNYKDEQEVFSPAGNVTMQRQFNTITLYNKNEKENIFYRQLSFPLNVGGKEYNILVRRSLEETEDLIQLILTITLLIVLILLTSLFLINRFFLSKLWKPFNTALQELKKYNLSAKKTVHLEESNIDEFVELNRVINIMINRISQDYEEIKNFTENASHEIQTPLAIISSKLELLSQSENLTEEQMNTIQSVYEAVNRLSKLNQSLILLTKIDNRQFNENEEVNISSLINRVINNYEELIAAKQIIMDTKIEDNIKLILNETLAEALISNLITNSIKHNLDKGSINIILNNKMLQISNTGAPLNTNPAELFKRFKKDQVSSDSLGLGLSIVNKICDRYGYQIQYSYLNSLHISSVFFMK